MTARARTVGRRFRAHETRRSFRASARAIGRDGLFVPRALVSRGATAARGAPARDVARRPTLRRIVSRERARGRSASSGTTSSSSSTLTGR